MNLGDGEQGLFWKKILENKTISCKFDYVVNHRNYKRGALKVCSKEFKKEVKEIQEQLKANIKDKELYNLIEQIVKEDPEMKKWVEEE